MPHILIVEDEAAIADTLIYALQAEGFATTWLSLAGAALEHQRQTPADLVILDVGLPDLSGFEACKRLRRFPEVPVLFLTARDAEIDRVVGLEIGADDYVVKPFSPPGGLIRLTAERDGAQLLLRLFNQGEPIPDYALPRLTERFYSLPRPASGRKSTGLGLNFVQEVASLHGGELSVGNAKGGVEVRLTLPSV